MPTTAAPPAIRVLFAALALLAAISPASARRLRDEPGAAPEVGAALDAARALAAQPAVAAAFATLEAGRERHNDWLVALSETPAPPFGEEVRAAAFSERLRALGLEDVRTDEVGNVVARRPGSVGERTVAVVAHLDTVFADFIDLSVEREGDVFRGPGVADNTRGLVVLLALLEAMERHGLQTRDDVLFIGSVGEEGLGDLRGVRHLFGEGGVRIDSFIAVDGGALERLVVSGVGSNRYRVMFQGPGGHSYGGFGRAHPHQALARAIAAFADGARIITEEPGEKATFSVGRIGGGTSINSIPFESWMEVDMRSVDPAKLDALDAAFRTAVYDALRTENARRTEAAAMTVEIAPVGRRPAGRGDPASPLVRNAVAAMAAMGVEARLAASSTDANIPVSLGVPAVTISRGGVSRDSHSLAETWEDADGHRAVQIALLLLLLEAGAP